MYNRVGGGAAKREGRGQVKIYSFKKGGRGRFNHG